MKNNFTPMLACALVLAMFSSCKKSLLQQQPDAGAGTSQNFKTMTTTAVIGVDASAVSNEVDSLMFGAVFEGQRLNMTGNQAVVDALNNLDLTFLRYPGGTFAVTEYDYIKSENGTPGYTQMLTPHLTFLQECFRRNITPQLIMPSKMYKNAIMANQNDPNLYTNARNYAQRFLRHVNDTLFNINHSISKKVTYWNIGNEDNLDEYPYYPQLAQYNVTDLNAIDGNLNLNVNWKWNAGNEGYTVNKKVSTVAAPGYDGEFTSVLEVPDTYSGGTLTESSIEDTLTKSINKNFANRPLQIGAWEVHSEVNNWPWMKSASVFNLRFATFVRAGASIACYWPLKNDRMENKERLANSDGTLAPCGKLFNWLHDNVNGKKVISRSGITDAGTVKATAYYKHYATYSELVVFVCGMDAPLDTPVELDISNFNLQSATGKTLTENSVVTNPGTASDGMALGDNTPTVKTIWPAYNTTAKTVKFSINKDSKWEVACIVIRTILQ